jgi:hypothetical protein
MQLKKDIPHTFDDETFLLSDEENEMLNKQSSCNEDFQDESRFFV